MLIKYTGKYVKIYFIMKITFWGSKPPTQEGGSMDEAWHCFMAFLSAFLIRK